MLRESRGTTVLAFLAGATVGGVAALLFAPRSGAETRKMIKEGVTGAVDWTKEKAAEGAGKVVDFAEEKRDDLKSAFEAGKEGYVKAKERLFKETSH